MRILMNTLRAVLKNEMFLIALLYSLAYGLILFNDGLFVDDWCFYHMAKSDIMAQLNEAGGPWIGYYMIFIYSFNTLIAPRLVIFFSFLLSALCLNRILKDIKEIDNASRLSIVLLFSVFPVNFTRIAISTSHYSLSLAIFFLAFLLLALYMKKRSLLLRIIALLLFYHSFLTGSLLVFYAIVMMYIFYIERRCVKTIKDALGVLSRYADFVILPLLFCIIKNLYFRPYLRYQGYNELHLSNILMSPVIIFQSFYASFLFPIDCAVRYAMNNFTYLICMVLLVFILLDRAVASNNRAPDKKYDLRLLGLGFVIFVSGVLPYALTGNYGCLADYQGRHQMLVPLGASLGLYYGLKICLRRLRASPAVEKLFYSFLIGAFIMANAEGYLVCLKDSFKQQALAEAFKSSDIIKNNTTFLFVDNTQELNSQGRIYRYFEYNSLFRAAFDDTRRFGSYAAVFTNTGDYIDQRDYPLYNMGQYVKADPQYTVIIDHGKYSLSNMRFLIGLFYDRIFKPQEYEEKLKDILVLKYVKL